MIKDINRDLNCYVTLKHFDLIWCQNSFVFPTLQIPLSYFCNFIMVLRLNKNAVKRLQTRSPAENRNIAGLNIKITQVK